MQKIRADNVEIAELDLDAGYAWVTFKWSHQLYGYDSLTLNVFEGHVSRRMPIRSGSGLLGVELDRGSIIFRFDAATAKQLEMDPDVEIEFEIDDTEFASLLRTLQAGGQVAEDYQ